MCNQKINNGNYRTNAVLFSEKNKIYLNVDEFICETSLFATFLLCKEVDVILIMQVKGRHWNGENGKISTVSLDAKELIFQELAKSLQAFFGESITVLKFDSSLFTDIKEFYKDFLHKQVSILRHELPATAISIILNNLLPPWFYVKEADNIFAIKSPPREDW